MKGFPVLFYSMKIGTFFSLLKNEGVSDHDIEPIQLTGFVHFLASLGLFPLYLPTQCNIYRVYLLVNGILCSREMIVQKRTAGPFLLISYIAGRIIRKWENTHTHLRCNKDANFLIPSYFIHKKAWKLVVLLKSGHLTKFHQALFSH